MRNLPLSSLLNFFPLGLLRYASSASRFRQNAQTILDEVLRVLDQRSLCICATVQWRIVKGLFCLAEMDWAPDLYIDWVESPILVNGARNVGIQGHNELQATSFFRDFQII
ncbi:hypothetical protein B0T25DRAFT_533930 [Lasiosphaeria hispida]|uniref:Uncharacterized protein n=1 Tax=Lasiosphaeria hispida TaxID=260671 RepID=A0AAJ0HRD3_9PEZI|nr:hypothetical protein B0T25DRAFT_533930 [Lasiosphaeria hispida]